MHTLIEIFLICFIVYILYMISAKINKKKYYISPTPQYYMNNRPVKTYDVVNSDNYETNDPYFHKNVWAGGNTGPDAPTGPAMGSTPMRSNCSMFFGLCKPYLGIQSYRRLYIEHPLV
jgi:hypothetical protein